MARHSHWAQIKLKKGALDKKRGKIFSKHARLIEVAARQSGGDINTSPNLRLAVENARADNMPRENIDRAIKKGTGELKSEEQLFEVTYEGRCPGGVALMIETLTNNKNRTNQTVKGILRDFGGSIGAMGSTSFLFETKGLIIVKPKSSQDSDELEIIDAGAEDILEIEDGFLIYTIPNELTAVKKKLEEKDFVVSSAELSKVPMSTVQITDAEIAKKIMELMEALEEEEDVTNVAMNCEL